MYVLKQYTNIKELTKAIEDVCSSEGKIIDGWKENRYWVSVFSGGKRSNASIRIKTLMPI